MSEWYGLLVCPVCGAEMGRHDGTLRCGSGHSFDIARQGYVNLLPGGAHTGTADAAEMVAARAAFFGRGHYATLVAAVAEAVAEAAEGVPGCVVDVGAGTGVYLAAALDLLPERTGLALDISKHATRRAAGAHSRAGAAVCDAWSALPVRSDVAAVVMSVFAPRNPAEFARILVCGGSFVTATPTPRHLAEIAGPLGMLSVDSRKAERLAGSLDGVFQRVREREVESALLLSREDAISALRMGPSAHHVTSTVAEARAALLPGPVPTTLSVIVSTWRKLQCGSKEPPADEESVGAA